MAGKAGLSTKKKSTKRIYKCFFCGREKEIKINNCYPEDCCYGYGIYLLVEEVYEDGSSDNLRQ